jgi:hypothetical protein
MAHSTDAMTGLAGASTVRAFPKNRLRRPIRLGVSIVGPVHLSRMVDQAGYAKELGFESALLIDHDGNTVPPQPRAMAIGSPMSAADISVSASIHLLRMGTRQSELVGIATLGDETAIARQVRYVNDKLGPLFDRTELAFSFLQVSMDDPNDLSVLRERRPDAEEDELRTLATLLDGSVAAAARRIHHFYYELGISYFTFHKTAATTWDTLRELVSAVKRSDSWPD